MELDSGFGDDNVVAALTAALVVIVDDEIDGFGSLESDLGLPTK